MKGKPNRTALAAWDELKRIGGIEVDNRDAEFEERLRITLSPKAANLDEALRAASTDELVRGVFSLVAPYTEMFRAILSYFEKAGARYGKSQWRIAVADTHVELKHFEEFVRSWTKLPFDLDIPAIDSHGLEIAYDALYQTSKELAQQRLDFRKNGAKEARRDINDWLNAYGKGGYPPLPRSMQPSSVPAPLHDTAAILQVAIDVIRSHWPDRENMLASWRPRMGEARQDDGFHPLTLASRESDFMLGAAAFLIARYESLPGDQQRSIGQFLASAYANYPRRRHGITARVEELERILSLPVWRYRHELYAVWIATEIMAAVNDHDCELHAVDGKITFAVRDAKLATITSTVPEVVLCGERRSPLADPIGKGRTDNVQPDFTLWRGTGASEACGLVVEVKHYEKNAPLKFREALVDYARAHTHAEVVLVSHGPARSPMQPEDRAISQRCHVIGELSVGHQSSRDELARFVRDLVGAPLRRSSATSQSAPLLVDISGSMERFLSASDFVALIKQLAGTGPVALADDALRATIPADEFEAEVKKLDHGATAGLSTVVQDLLQAHAELILLTDDDGAREVRGLNIVSKRAIELQGGDIEIIEIKR